MFSPVRILRATVLVALCATCAQPARAQSAGSSRCESHTSWSQLFTGTASDLRRLPSRESFNILAAGAVAAIGSHYADNAAVDELSEHSSLNDPFKPGAVIGGTPLQMTAALAAYTLGRALHKPCAASVGADLFRAQLIAEGLTMVIKESTRRARPEGTGFSFPSGHTTVSFASATVLQRHFGWKIGLPAYAAATYVATSRIQMKRHYLSDVAFGAALGIVAGRTVTIGGGRMMLSPMATPDGVGASFTWLGRSSVR